MSADQIVITGAAALTPLGIGFEATRAGLRAGASGIRPSQSFSGDPVLEGMYLGELPELDPKAILGHKGLRAKDRLTLMLLCCIQRDLGEQLAGLSDLDQVGLVVGTTFSGLNSQVDFTAAYERGGSRALNATAFPNMVLNTAASQANIWFGLTGMSATVTNGYTAGLDAVVFAADQLRVGRVEQVLAGGVDELAPVAVHAFSRRGYLSPTGQALPLDRRHDGTLLGEGAALVLLETRASAEVRGVPVLAEVLGYGSSFDSDVGDGFAPGAKGPARAMRQALAAAGLDPAQVDVVAASASGYPPADDLEASAIRDVFGAHAADLPLVAYKGAFGECLGASGALQLIAVLADLQDGTLSGTCRFERGEGGDLKVPAASRAAPELKTVMVNALGYTGSNTSLVLRRQSRAKGSPVAGQDSVAAEILDHC